MDGFNPLDLLASAAELQQQKHDDGPERIIISRPKRYNASKTYVNINEQKENRDLSTNNNVTKSKPSVVIVKKIRKSEINSDIEKMLDEHNYGNAKRNNNKLEKGLESVIENNDRKRHIVDKSTISEQTTSTDRDIEDKGDSTSNINDSEIVHNVNNEIDSSDKSDCLNSDCAKYQGNTKQKCSECDIQESTEIILCNNEPNSIKEQNDLESATDMLTNKNVTAEDKCDTVTEKSNLTSLNDNGIELNEQTGELILKNRPESITYQSSVCEMGMPKQDAACSPAENTLDNINKVESDNQSKVMTSGNINFVNKLDDATTLDMPSPLATEKDRSTLVENENKLLNEQKQFYGPNFESSVIRKKPVGLNITQKFPDFQNNKVTVSSKTNVSYDSLKDLEIGSTICTDDSSASVHLLSPDCRNPDSVGIAVSPKINYKNEFCLGNRNFKLIVEKETELSKSPHKISENNLQSVKEYTNNPDNPSQSSLHLSEAGEPNELDTPSVETVSESRELNVESGLLFAEKVDDCEKSANDTLSPLSRENNIFCFDSDHCYAGVQGKVNTSGDYGETDSFEQNESEEVKTPQGSLSELSQDSGYEDVTQSPEMLQQQTVSLLGDTFEKSSALKSLVPVLVSLNKNGSLTVHDNNLTRTLGGPVFLHEDMKFITGTNLAKVQLHSTTGKVTFPSLTEATPKLIRSTPESVIGLLTPKKQEMTETKPLDISPPKYGKFRIGTFASFSNSGVGLESPTKLISPTKVHTEEKSDNLPLITGRSNSGKSSPVVDTLGSLVQKVKSSLSPSSQIDHGAVDHIQHDHDYCTKNLMPSVVNSFLEARLLSKDNVKGKVTHAKGKKSDPDFKPESKSSKRKRNSTSVSKEEISEEFDVDSESDLLGINTSYKQKCRGEKYIETKRTDPKVKITGSSDFQDQFVYFMNTKKRSRRRESKDAPIPIGTDRVFIPPKPGDIVVPHLTDQDIENLKLRSKQGKNTACTPCSNYLRNEFMAAKLNNGVFPPTQPAETVDDEKTIINTILSLENEDLVSSNQTEPVPYNESMEMYGQGLNADIMNLLPEQMNLTPEQMDMLYSAVDEVQNSSPDLIGAEKLVSSDTSGPAVPLQTVTYNDSSVPCTSTITHEEGKVGDTPVSTPTQNDSAYSTEAESAEKDVICATEVKQLPDNQQSFETSRDVNAGEQLTEQNDDKEKQSTVINNIPDDRRTESIESVNNDLSVLPLSSDSYTSLENLPQNFTKESDVSPLISTPVVSTDKAELPAITLESSRSSTFGSDINSVPSSSLTPEMSIPQIDKELYLLGKDFDKSDVFQDGSSSSPAQVDYNAPWIVTVSMYWNDLPAIMINNQPFVRLVDIHKQILPAKDTGILKKRCQLMGIEVDNCSEMQRYFLVQYGKAFNSKSTLIISKDDAKVLIGYYVDPQPKTLRPEDQHKSIVDHRREQLRRIALARRAAIRAQRMVEKKSESDPRDISHSKDEVNIGQPIQNSMQEQSKKMGKLKSGHQHNQLAKDDGIGRQRATRHKKINFLEMLRGDTGSNAHEEESVNEHLKKHRVQHSEAKRRSRLKGKKIQVVKYTIETDSSEETDSVNSDYTLESSDSESSSSSDVNILKRPVEQKLSPYFLAKVKNRVKGISKPYRKRNIKGGIKRPKSSLTTATTPLAIQVINKSTAVSKLVKSSFRPSVGLKSKKEMPQKKASGILSKNVLMPEKMDMNDSNDCQQEKDSDCVNKDFAVDDVSKSELKLDEKHSDSVVSINNHPCLQSAEVEENNSNGIEVERTVANQSLELKPVESVNIQTDLVDTEDIGNDHLNSEDVDKAIVQDVKSETVAIKENKLEENFRKVDSENKSHSPSLVENSTSVMKRKGIVQIRSDETPVRIIHREANPQQQQRSRGQLGELFVDHYHNKRSLCVRCYTCRKLMSVDNFLHHLHDVSGALQSVTSPQTIDLSEESLNQNENKLWETFLRKKELFDNNQLTSDSRDINEDNLVFDTEGKDSPYCEYSKDDKNCQSGPRIITTPVSPVKRDKIMLKSNSEEKKKSRLLSNKISQVPGCQTHKIIPDDKSVRTSSRKRKMKHLYGFDNYSFTKFPRLMKNAVVENESKD